VDKLSKYKENTKRNFLISIVSILSLSPKPMLKKLHDKYYSLMMQKNSDIKKDVKPNELTETQEKNWISWKDVEEKYKALEIEVDALSSKKDLSESEYNTLLSYAILSLYIHQAPRRNKDYQIMLVTNKYNVDLSKDRNYLDLDNKTFIFNDYKTVSKYGTQHVAISNALWSALTKYFKHHPKLTVSKKNVSSKALEYFLVYKDNSPLDKVNSITRILNKVFGKAIGSSMLRHIYLTGKYGEVLDEQKKDALDMAHSEAMQKDYIKKPKSITVML
jgi:integrase